MAIEYDLSVVRQLLAAAYSSGELDTLVFDLYHDLYDDLSPVKSQKVIEIVEYAQRRGRVEELLSYTKRHNSYQYSLFEARLGGKVASVEKPSAAAVQRLKQEREGIQRQYDLLSEKVGRLRQALAVEADVIRKFQLEHQLAEAEKDRAAVAGRLNEIDEALA
jgi:hypothetical protein